MDLFFVLSKTLWVLVNPGNFLIFALILALLLRWRTIASIVLFTLLLLTLYPLGNILLQPLENRYPQAFNMPDDVAGVIVLGGAEQAELSHIWGQPQFNSAAERDMAILPLLQRYPQRPVIISGGSSSVQKPEYRGADVVQHWFAEQGLESAVIFDRDSRNTFENAIYSQESLPADSDIADEKGWLLVTSAFHMPRAMGVFQQQGWNVIPYPVDYYSKPLTFSNWRPNLGLNMHELSIAVREWIGLTAYYLTDKTSSWFPAKDLN